MCMCAVCGRKQAKLSFSILKLLVPVKKCTVSSGTNNMYVGGSNFIYIST